MSGAWGKGSTWAWRKLRKQILERDQYRCQLRIEGICKTRADCVHHLDGKAMGDDPDRLVASCTPCNLRLGNPAGRDPRITPRTQW